MEPSQRKFRTVLFGLLAVATAVGGGWAVHIALSYQDHSTRATNGGVLSQGNQGSPATHTGSGNINQGIQIHNQGPGGVHVEGGIHQHKHQHIGIPLEEYEAGLKRREQEVTERLQQIHNKEQKQAQTEQAAECRVLETEKAEIERRLADTQASYQRYVQELKKRIAHLEGIRGQVPDELLDQAREALSRGDQGEADRRFAELETRTQAVIQAAAEATRVAPEAAYQRSRIALEQIRYRTAYEHGQRAVRLAPENGLYLTGAGELAQILGDYKAARDYYEQALVSGLKTYGEDHPEVATDRNNLGEAWRKLGEYHKAVGYYEPALAIFERRLGPSIRTRGPCGKISPPRGLRKGLSPHNPRRAGKRSASRLKPTRLAEAQSPSPRREDVAKVFSNHRGQRAHRERHRLILCVLCALCGLEAV